MFWRSFELQLISWNSFSFTASNMLHMMNNTNRIFEGTTPNVTRVYFTDGDLDPARVLGVLEQFRPEIYVDLIPSKDY